MSGPSGSLPEGQQAEREVEERLIAVARKFEPAIRERVTKLLVSAVEAITKLCDLDLVRQESDAEGGGSHSLAVWEELAPVMMETVQSVNTLVAIAQDTFPSAPRKDALDTLDAFGPDAGDEQEQDLEPQGEEQEIASLVLAVTSGLMRDVRRLGERLRNPSVMADPWTLVGDLLEFRGRLRTGVGELIYQITLRVEEVERPEVVPGYANDLASALLVRAASTNLSFLFRGHARRIGKATGESIQAALADALKELGLFSRTRALGALRTADKRIFLETRATLSRLLRERPIAVHEVKQEVENMARFLDSLSVISRRENLRVQDRARLAGVGRLLESVQEAIGCGELLMARGQLVNAVQAAWAIYGRDPQLDTYLREQHHYPAEWLSDSELGVECARLGQLLADISAP